jgi:hypothetical protein
VRAARETETTQENIQDWFELNERDPKFQLQTEGEIAAVIFLFTFISTALLIKYFISFLSFFFVF